MTTIGALGLGKLLGLGIIWIDEKLRQHYNPAPKQNRVFVSPLAAVSPLFFDKDFIRNLKV